MVSGWWQALEESLTLWHGIGAEWATSRPDKRMPFHPDSSLHGAAGPRNSYPADEVNSQQTAATEFVSLSLPLSAQLCDVFSYTAALCNSLIILIACNVLLELLDQ